MPRGNPSEKYSTATQNSMDRRSEGRRPWASGALKAVNRETAEQVRQESNRAAVAHYDAFENAHAVPATESLEIGDGAEVDVGRVEPLVRQVARHRHVAEDHVQPVAPVAKVGESDDDLAADAQHFADYALAAPHRLQRLRQDHVIERAVGESRQPAFEVALDNVDAVPHARENTLVVDLDAVAGAAALLVKITQQRAVATAQIEDARVRLDPVGDRGKIRTQHRVRIHTPASDPKCQVFTSSRRRAVAFALVASP